jgi:Holliday junction DNA helicase RuvA
LRGIVIEKRPPELIIECAGVGYEVLAPLSAFGSLPETGREVLLHTHFVVREDAQILFGFTVRAERDLFRELIKVSGIGPKTALAVLSGMSVDEFLRVIHDSNLTALTRVPGIGKKTAERLLIEMRDKLGGFEAPQPTMSGNSSAAPSRTRLVSEAVSALVSLGYKPIDASKAISQVDDGERTQEELIRLSLRQMAK